MKQSKYQEFWVEPDEDSASGKLLWETEQITKNGIKVIEYSAYQELLDQLNSIPEHHWRDIAQENVLLRQKLKWLIKHSIDTASISKAKAAELLDIPLIDLDEDLQDETK